MHPEPLRSVHGAIHSGTLALGSCNGGQTASGKVSNGLQLRLLFSGGHLRFWCAGSEAKERRAAMLRTQESSQLPGL